MLRRGFQIIIGCVVVLAGVSLTRAHAGQTRIAVAANFTAPANTIAARFAAGSGHRAVYSFGSTGQLYAQISQAAPFDVFLAADEKRPRMAIKAGFAIKGTAFPYAIGRIALYSRDTKLVRGVETLKQRTFSRLAMANPATAPYGAAALEVLAKLGLASGLKDKIVRGNNIAQVYQFIATGNAELGFVALAQIAGHKNGSRWIVPANMHAPIAQTAVLLNNGANNSAAQSFLAFLRGPEAQAIIKRFGYDSSGE